MEVVGREQSVTAEFARTNDTFAAWKNPSSKSSASDEPEIQPSASLPIDGYIKHYEIIRKLGEGGMGTVLLARDTKLGRLVAIKLLHGGGRASARLLAEAQATARCRHDNIVVIHDVDEIDGLPYMVLEYLEGRVLRDVLSNGAHGETQALPINLALDAIDIVTAVVRALSAAHGLGVVHRDLKPENIMILDAGQVKVLDFGLASLTSGASGASAGESSRQKSRSGTRPYMAPEQWLGGEIEPRTDIWAVGVLLYELVTGVHPLDPLTNERLSSIAEMDTPMPKLGDVRPELIALSNIVECCLKKQKEDRFASAEELLSALEALRDGGKNLALAEGAVPFAGLCAFQESDAGRFFGRDGDISTVVGKLRRHRLVTIAGASGAGKSSFVRAGVVPTLKRSGEEWDVIVLRPGRTPLSTLGEALATIIGPRGTDEQNEFDFRAEPGLLGTRLRAHCREHSKTHSQSNSGIRRALIFVDQFEELYTLVSDLAERSAFVKTLLGAADDASSPLRVVLCIRSDFLDRIAEDRHFMAEVTQGFFFLPPVGREGLCEALTKPVEVAGHRFENDAMITDILDELARTKTPLPILQFSGAELWEARDRERKLLTRQSYDALGGVVGALSTHADAVFSRLSPADQRLCQGVFLRLVTPERTRAIVSLSELASLADDQAIAEALIQHLCGARLLHLENEGEQGSIIVEIVHESLIERWPRLAQWLGESTADASFLARLRVAASQWRAGGEVDGLLWRDRAAEEARAFHERRLANPDAKRGLPLGRSEEKYLFSVIDHFDRARRQKQRIIAGAFVFLGVVSILVFFLAMRAQKHAERADAESRRVTEQNSELAFQALRGRNATRMLAARKLQDDPTMVLALLREIEAGDIPKDWPDLVSAALSHGVSRDISAVHPSDIIYSAVVSPDGKRIVTASGDKTARIVSFDGLEPITTLRGHEDYIWSAEWSPDGTRIVTASGDKTARIFRADGAGEPIVLRGHSAALCAANWSPDGSRVVTASDDKTARVYRAEDGVELFVIPHDAEVNAAKYSPDGRRIVTASADGITRLWNANGEGPPLLLRGHQGMVVGATFRPDGQRIATAGIDGTVRVWDALKGTELFTLGTHADKVMSVAWSPDGERIASASKDKTVRVFQSNGSGEPLVLRGHKHWVYSARWSADSRYLVTASLDKMIRVWNLDGIMAPSILKGRMPVWSSNGEFMAFASSAGPIRVWKLNEPRSVSQLRGDKEGVINLDISPDGALVASGSADKTVRLWKSFGQAEPLWSFEHPDWVTMVRLSPRGDRIVSTSRGGMVYISRVDGVGEPRVFQAPVDREVYAMAKFDASGERVLIVAGGMKTAWILELEGSGSTVELTGHEDQVRTAEWSPDGARIATVSDDRTARIWDATTKQTTLVLRGHEAQIENVAWSLDGTRIVTASKDMTARIYRVDGSSEPPIVLRGHDGEVHSAVFSPDGARILTASSDRTARVWNADGSGQPVVLGGASVRVLDAAWSPDSAFIATNSEDGMTRLWRDAQPFMSPADPRLWNVTTHCIPMDLRMTFLQVTAAVARAEHEACERRVAEARATSVQQIRAFPMNLLP
jgi:WD40 repeat protein